MGYKVYSIKLAVLNCNDNAIFTGDIYNIIIYISFTTLENICRMLISSFTGRRLKLDDKDVKN